MIKKIFLLIFTFSLTSCMQQGDSSEGNCFLCMEDLASAGRKRRLVEISGFYNCRCSRGQKCCLKCADQYKPNCPFCKTNGQEIFINLLHGNGELIDFFPQEKLMSIKERHTKRTTLMSALENRNYLAVSKLLTFWNDFSAVDRDHKTTMHHAALSSPEILALLLNKTTVGIDSLDKYQKTPLSIAITNGNPINASLLLDKIGDVDLQFQDESLNFAINNRFWSLAKVLIDKGFIAENQHKTDGLLKSAIRYNAPTNIFHSLLTIGADINTSFSDGNQTPYVFSLVVSRKWKTLKCLCSLCNISSLRNPINNENILDYAIANNISIPKDLAKILSRQSKVCAEMFDVDFESIKKA